jgi:hypothetical protein
MMIKRFTRMVDPGVLKPLVGNAPETLAATVLGVADGGVILRSLAGLQPPPTDQQKFAMMGFREQGSKPPNPLAYKARPLERDLGDRAVPARRLGTEPLPASAPRERSREELSRRKS